MENNENDNLAVEHPHKAINVAVLSPCVIDGQVYINSNQSASFGINPERILSPPQRFEP